MEYKYELNNSGIVFTNTLNDDGMRVDFCNGVILRRKRLTNVFLFIAPDGKLLRRAGIGSLDKLNIETIQRICFLFRVDATDISTSEEQEVFLLRSKI